MIFFTFFCFVLTGIMPGQYLDFAADSCGSVYISSPHKIFVYEHGSCSRIVELPHKAYEFTIDNADRIVVWDSADADCIYIYDLHGSLMDTIPLDKNLLSPRSFYDAYGDSSSSYTIFVSGTGNIYRQQTKLFRTEILCGDDVVYQMPMLEYIVRVAMTCAMLAFPILVTTGIVMRIKK